MQYALSNPGAILGALLLAMVFLVWSALLNPTHHELVKRDYAAGWRRLFAGFLHEDAGVTITYTSKFLGWGTNTAPTATQAAPLQVQTAQVNFADADTQAVIIHNWGASNNQSFPSFLFPEVWMYLALGESGAASFATNFTFGLSNTNSITINKLSIAVGSGGTFNVIMRRPYSVSG